MQTMAMFLRVQRTRASALTTRLSAIYQPKDLEKVIYLCCSQNNTGLRQLLNEGMQVNISKFLFSSQVYYNQYVINCFLEELLTISPCPLFQIQEKCLANVSIQKCLKE